jgi:hypothetical protein
LLLVNGMLSAIGALLLSSTRSASSVTGRLLQLLPMINKQAMKTSAVSARRATLCHGCMDIRWTPQSSCCVISLALPLDGCQPDSVSATVTSHQLLRSVGGVR